MALFYSSSKLIIFLTLLTYVLTDNVLTSEKVRATLKVYSIEVCMGRLVHEFCLYH